MTGNHIWGGGGADPSAHLDNRATENLASRHDTPQILLTTLRSRGVLLQGAEGRLHYDAPAGALCDDDLAKLRRHKFDILALLAIEEPSVIKRVAAMRKRHRLEPGTPIPTLTTRDVTPGSRGCLSCGEPCQTRDTGPQYRCESCQYAARLVIMEIR